MPTDSPAFQLDPAFVAGLNQQPTRTASLHTALATLRADFARQESAIGNGPDIGVLVLPTLQQTDQVLADLQAHTNQWDSQLQTGLTQVVADFNAFCQSIDQQANGVMTQIYWRKSIGTAQAVGASLNQLSGQVTNAYLKLPAQQRQLIAVSQAVSIQMTASQALVSVLRQSMNAQQKRIDDIKDSETFASLFVGSELAEELGDLLTGMNQMQDNLDNLTQQTNQQSQIQNSLNQYLTALGGLTTELQAFSGQFAQISNQWTAMAVDMGNFTDALTSRVHADSVFFGAQVRAAASDLNAVLQLLAATPVL